jgi:small GTP-binding protein
MTNKFDSDIKSTLGAGIYVKFMEMHNKRISLQIWDFGGEERFRFLLPSYANGASGGIFMYDITNFNSLLDNYGWVTTFRKSLSNREEKIPVLMVGGKMDLEENRQCHEKEIEKLCKKLKIFGNIDCSSKTGKNVEDLFEILLNKILQVAGVI